jgi:hypothetical protein
MPQVVPRLHSEFFDLLQKAERVLEEKAKVSKETARLIVKAAVSAYVDEGRSPFYAYLLTELRSHPALYEAVPGDVLNELFESGDAAVLRQDWLHKTIALTVNHPPLSFQELVDIIQE